MVVHRLSADSDIATHAPCTCRPATSLVSKRWNRLVFTEPALWRLFELSSASLAALADPAQQGRWFDCKLRLLQRVAPLVQSFAISDDCNLLLQTQQQLLPARWLDQLLQLLQPESLYALVLDGRWPPYAEIAAALAQPPAAQEQRSLGLASQLQRFTGLEHLALRCAATLRQHEAQALSGMQYLDTLILSQALGLPNCLPAVLQELSAPLESLCLSGPHMPAGTVAAVLRLTGLQFLELRCFKSALEDPQPLTALRQLTRLVLVSGGGAPVNLPQPCQFSSALQLYTMAGQEVSRTVPPQAGARPDLRVGDGACLFGCLRPVSLPSTHDSPSRRFLQMAGARLITVNYCDGQLGITAFITPSLGGLLTALLPAGQPGLRSLNLFATELTVEAVCTRDVAASSRLLASVDSLALTWCDLLTHGSGDNVLAAMLAYASSLRSLQLDSCLLEQPFPACVLHATSLTSLSLARNELEELPEGPALAGGVDC